MTPIEQLAEAIEGMPECELVDDVNYGMPHLVHLDSEMLKSLVADWRKMKVEREQNNVQYKFVPLA